LNDIMFFTDKGRVFNTKVYELPASSRIAKGQAIVNILQLAPDEKVTAIISIDSKKKNGANDYFFMGTRNGVVKKTLIDAYKNVRKSGLIAVKLNNGDELKWVCVTSGKDEMILITRNGQSVHFNEHDVRPMGRSAAGVRGIKLKSGDEVISMGIATDENSEVFTILENGYGKKTKISNFTLQKRGGIGIRASKVTQKTGHVVEALVNVKDDGDMVIISKQGQIIRMPIKSVKRLGRDTQGVTLMRLNSGDKVSSMTILKKEKIEESATPENSGDNAQDKLDQSDKSDKGNEKSEETKNDEKTEPVKKN